MINNPLNKSLESDGIKFAASLPSTMHKIRDAYCVKRDVYSVLRIADSK